MKKRSIVVVGGLVIGLLSGATATAWADGFTPSIEEPVFQLGLLRGTPLGGSAPDGNTSSANQGRSYQGGGGDYPGGYSGYQGSRDTPEDLYGYWRTGESTAGSDFAGRSRSGGPIGDGESSEDRPGREFTGGDR